MKGCYLEVFALQERFAPLAKNWYFSNKEKPKHELKAYLTKGLTPFVLVSAFACILLDVLPPLSGLFY